MCKVALTKLCLSEGANSRTYAATTSAGSQIGNTDTIFMLGEADHTDDQRQTSLLRGSKQGKYQGRNRLSVLQPARHENIY